MEEPRDSEDSPQLVRLEEVETCNECLKTFTLARDGFCCICCNDSMRYCGGCIPSRNTLQFRKGILAVCDFCGATFRDSDTSTYDDAFYDGLEAEYEITKEEVICKIRALQNAHFKKNQLLDRIRVAIAKLQMEIDDLEEEERYICTLSDEDTKEKAW